MVFKFSSMVSVKIQMDYLLSKSKLVEARVLHPW